MHPGGILTNLKTGRFHPIIFRRAPLPSEGFPDPKQTQRHKSIGHHTDGFDTIELAQAHMAEQGWEDKGSRWDWNGVDTPALVYWY